MTNTPGPWIIGNHGSIITNNPDRQVEIVGDHAQETIEWYGGHVICETVTLGNAALIAAAPDLLAACKAALGTWPESLDTKETRQLRAAIAKAEAQQ